MLLLWFLRVLPLLWILFWGCCSAQRDHLRTSDFSGSQVLSVRPETEEQLQALGRLYEKDKVDFWSAPAFNESTNVLVTADQRDKFNRFLDKYNLTSRVVMGDVLRVVQTQQKSLVSNRQTQEMSWDAYHYPETMFSWMQELQADYHPFVKVITIGRSFEDQPLQLIKISRGYSINKFGVFIDGGIHAREWISPAVATFIVNDLARNVSQHRDLLETYDFYILPLLNPDGYRHTCNYNRFWRKSRRSFSFLGDLVGCRGIDLNRNFGFHWKEFGGAGFVPCSLLYAGDTPFSEPETKAVKDFVIDHPEIDWKFYFSLHSFSQKWMTPWGYTSEHPRDYDEMIRVANIGNEALYAVHGTKYQVGSMRETLYTAAGTSTDWFKSIGVPYSYAIELRDYGLWGFLLPASQIIPTGEEVWTGIKASLREVRKMEMKKRQMRQQKEIERR